MRRGISASSIWNGIAISTTIPPSLTAEFKTVYQAPTIGHFLNFPLPFWVQLVNQTDRQTPSERQKTLPVLEQLMGSGVGDNPILLSSLTD
jgi:hypothetical protein